MDEPARADMLPLLELQQIDSAADRLSANRAKLPEQAELETHIAQRIEDAAIHAEVQEELDQVIREQTRLETDTQMITERMDKERGRLEAGTVTSPREMANIQAELDALGRRRLLLEDQDLEVMERREELEKVAGDLAGGLSDLDGKITDTTQRRDGSLARIDAELSELRGRRDGLTPGMHPEVLDRYEQVRAKQGGIGVAALEQGTCRACSLPLSPMAREDIKNTDDPFIRCENCRRLLVIA